MKLLALLLLCACGPDEHPSADGGACPDGYHPACSPHGCACNPNVDHGS